MICTQTLQKLHKSYANDQADALTDVRRGRPRLLRDIGLRRKGDQVSKRVRRNNGEDTGGELTEPTNPEFYLERFMHSPDQGIFVATSDPFTEG